MTVEIGSIIHEVVANGELLLDIFECLKETRRETDKDLDEIKKKVIHFGVHILEGIDRIEIELGETCSAADITALSAIINQTTTDQTNEIIQTLRDQITINLNELTQSTQTINNQLSDIQQTLANQEVTIQNNFDQSNQLTDNRITQLEQTINLLEQNLELQIQQLQIDISDQLLQQTPCK